MLLAAELLMKLEFYMDRLLLAKKNMKYIYNLNVFLPSYKYIPPPFTNAL